MRASSNDDRYQTNDERSEMMSLQQASRFVACAAAASGIVWGTLFAMYRDSASDGFLLLVSWVTAHLIGQAVTSAISFKAGGAFAFFALAALSLDVLQTLFGAIYANVPALLVSTTPAICSLWALHIFRRHSKPQPHTSEIVG